MIKFYLIAHDLAAVQSICDRHNFKEPTIIEYCTDSLYSDMPYFEAVKNAAEAADWLKEAGYGVTYIDGSTWVEFL